MTDYLKIHHNLLLYLLVFKGLAFQFIRYKHFIKFDFVFNISDLMFIIVNYSAVLLVIVHFLYKKRIEIVIYYCT